MNAPNASEALVELALRRQAEDDFYEFVKQAWKHVEGGKRFQGGWAVKATCEHLEELYYGRIKRLLINQPPRTTKSTVVSVLFPVWCWIKDSSLQIFSMSYAERLAVRDNVKSRRLIKSKWFQTRWGDRFTLSADQDAKERVDNMQGGYRVVAGLDGTITGDGGDLLILDDPNNVRDQSDVALENALDTFTDVLPTRFNDFKLGRMVVVQQRCNEKDISGYILGSLASDWICLILPMEFEVSRRCITVPLKSTNGEPWQDPRTEEGELLCPERIGDREVRMLKKALGSDYAIAGQLQQRPAPAEGGMIKRAWFMPWKQEESPKITFIIQSWDTAMSSKKEAAYSACTTWGVFHDDHQHPCIILLGAWRKKVEFPELYKQVQRMGKDYRATTPDRVINPRFKPDIILVEEKASGIQLVQTLNRTGLVLTPWNPDKYGDKVERVRRITHIIEAHRVYVPYRAPDFTKPKSYAELLISQAVVFPKGDSRDFVDTCSMTIQRCINSGWIQHGLEVEATREEEWRREHFGDDRKGFY